MDLTIFHSVRIASLLYFAVMIAMLVMMFIKKMHHFYDDVYGKNACFMMPLPVSDDTVIFGRLLSAFLMDVITFGISVLPMVLYLIKVPDLSINDLFGWGSENMALCIIVFACSLLSSTLALYFCIAVGMLKPAHPVVLSIICFVLFYAVVGWIAHQFVGDINVGVTVQTSADGTVVVSSSLQDAALGWIIAIDTVIGIICYIGTRWLMKNHLNVE